MTAARSPRNVAAPPLPRASAGTTAPPHPRARVAAVDALRALALLAMIAYHFCYDLRYFGVLHADFEHDPLWLGARALILGAFLAIAGASLVLAERAGQTPIEFWRHVGVIGACAAIVSAASYVMFPRTYIWFGVLHAIAVSLVIARPFVRHPRVALVIGTSIVIAGVAFSDPAFDNRALGWLGFMTVKPWTEDYVPLFPWAGVAFCGIAIAHAFARRQVPAPAWLTRAPRWLLWCGRHTLAIYLLHQPVLLGALWVVLHR
jgi:uncharacterized membrane protein